MHIYWSQHIKYWFSMALPSFLIFLCFFFLDWYYFPFLVSVQTSPFSISYTSVLLSYSLGSFSLPSSWSPSLLHPFEVTLCYVLRDSKLEHTNKRDHATFVCLVKSSYIPHYIFWFHPFLSQFHDFTFHDGLIEFHCWIHSTV